MASWLSPGREIPPGTSPILEAWLLWPPSSRRRTRHDHTEPIVVVTIRRRVVVAVGRKQVVAIVVVPRRPAQHTPRLTPAPLCPGCSHQQADFAAGTNFFLQAHSETAKNSRPACGRAEGKRIKEQRINKRSHLTSRRRTRHDHTEPIAAVTTRRRVDAAVGRKQAVATAVAPRRPAQHTPLAGWAVLAPFPYITS